MVIPSFQSQFLVLQLVKQWLTVKNFVLVVASKHLTTAKQCLTNFCSKNYVFSERSPLHEAKTITKTFEKVEMLKMLTIN